MMENSRDPRFLIEDASEETNSPKKQSPTDEQSLSDEEKTETQNSQQKQGSSEVQNSAEAQDSSETQQSPEEESPLPTDFYRPTPGQSEYSYLFGEQEEIDPYDYVMEKVQNRKKTRLPQQEQQEPSEPGAEKATERKPAKPRPTVERDLSLEKPAGEEKKSLRESFSELLRWVTGGLRAGGETVPTEKSEKQENEKTEEQAEDGQKPPEDTPGQQSDDSATDLFAAASQHQWQEASVTDIPEEEDGAKRPAPQHEQNDADSAPEKKMPERDTPPEEDPKEASVRDVLTGEAALKETVDAEMPPDRKEPSEETPGTEAPAEEKTPLRQVQVLPVAEPAMRPRRVPDADSVPAGQTERRALCVELDVDRLFCGEELPEIRVGTDGEELYELKLEYAARAGKVQAVPKRTSAPRLRFPFLNRKQSRTEEPRAEAEKTRNQEIVHHKSDRQQEKRPDAEIGRRNHSVRREPTTKSGEDGKSGKSDSAEEHTAPPDSTKAFRQRLSKESKITLFRLLAVGAIGIFLTVPAVCARADVPLAAWMSPRQSPRIFSLINFVGIGVCLLLCRSVVTVGLLSFFKGQKSAGADGAFSIAAIACALQALVGIIRPDAVAAGDVWLYAPVGALGLCGNLLGKLCMLLRTRENYAELCAMPESFALARLEEESRVQKMVDADVPARLTIGAVSAMPEKGFLRGALEADLGERSTERIFAFGFFGALAAALISFFATPSSRYDAALASYTAVCCLCAPFTATLSVNLPLKRACRAFRGSGAVAVGWRAADLFGETGCVVLRDEELFPADAVVLSGIKTLSGGRIDDVILDAAALLREAGGPMRTVFYRVIRGQTGILPRAEQVAAEQGGFSGWVQGRRVFVGSGELMAAHGITPPSSDYEAKNCPEGTIPVYLARGGELCALFTVEYHADPVLCGALQRLVRCGGDVAVLTTDSNLSAEMIAEKFSVPESSVTIVPDVQELHAADVRQEDLEQPAVILRSPGAPALWSTACCIEAKALFQLAVLLQMAGTLLGLVLVFVFCAAGSIARIGAAEMMIFQLFWTLAVLVIPSLKRF